MTQNRPLLKLAQSAFAPIIVLALLLSPFWLHWLDWKHGGNVLLAIQAFLLFLVFPIYFAVLGVKFVRENTARLSIAAIAILLCAVWLASCLPVIEFGTFDGFLECDKLEFDWQIGFLASWISGVFGIPILALITLICPVFVLLKKLANARESKRIILALIGVILLEAFLINALLLIGGFSGSFYKDDPNFLESIGIAFVTASFQSLVILVGITIAPICRRLWASISRRILSHKAKENLGG